ncbi:MAG: hypothetical protein JSS10_05575 [Verrucomicrobia bacterium]|nr:hypothetical protein [Verrucomicrobiota bacterium]
MTSMMASFAMAPFSPLIELTAPLYHLCTGQGNKQQNIERWILAAFRTATVAGLFLAIIPFNYFFGHHDNLSGSLALASQYILHPYAAALFNATINGGFLLVTKTTDIVYKQQLILTRKDAGDFARALGFLYVAYFLKDALKDHPLDKKYQEWANRLASSPSRRLI